MSRLTRALAALLAAALFLAGCSGESPAEAPDPDTSATPEQAAKPSPEPSPTEEPPELIGGGTELFPDKRFIALYGHPGIPALGALGEQGPVASAERAQELAEDRKRHV